MCTKKVHITKNVIGELDAAVEKTRQKKVKLALLQSWVSFASHGQATPFLSCGAKLGAMAMPEQSKGKEEELKVKQYTVIFYSSMQVSSE